MKRVQALVSGKKKQCTKLPKPAVRGKSSLPDLPVEEHPRSDQDTTDIDDNGGDNVVTSTTAAVSTTSTTAVVGSSGNTSTITASSPRTASKIPGM